MRMLPSWPTQVCSWRQGRRVHGARPGGAGGGARGGNRVRRGELRGVAHLRGLGRAEYQQLFAKALASSATTMAHAGRLITEVALAERGPEPVLVSLASAATPVGALMSLCAPVCVRRRPPALRRPDRARPGALTRWRWHTWRRGTTPPTSYSSTSGRTSTGATPCRRRSPRPPRCTPRLG
ncbi:cysteine protease StiP domain-containing protein [Modestobacter sp. VKM Ac-2983]|uniref:cysteine protease StiP domain-containing protein n=1 Tax=Modestobacter sp. VKM Ac-2983 TaxID=3004137 RepID=UPI003FA541E3